MCQTKWVMICIRAKGVIMYQINWVICVRVRVICVKAKGHIMCQSECVILCITVIGVIVHPEKLHMSEQKDCTICLDKQALLCIIAKGCYCMSEQISSVMSCYMP